MEDLSLHVLDIAENSIEAGATRIEILVNENKKSNVLTLQIKDNGKGMDKKSLKKVFDPFYTTKEMKRIGLGLSMLAQAAKEADGSFDISSKKGKGTTIIANFVYDHVDRKPIGNMAETIVALIASKGLDVDFVYKHTKNSNHFVLDTRVLKRELNGVPINDVEVLSTLRESLKRELRKL